jgi:hypothetical protein
LNGGKTERAVIVKGCIDDLNDFVVGKTTRLTDREKNNVSQDKHPQLYKTILCFLMDTANARRNGNSGQKLTCYTTGTNRHCNGDRDLGSG